MLIRSKFEGYKAGIRLYPGKSSPPPAPDYSAAARETAAGNKEAAQFAVNANRINQFTPYGSLTYSRTPRAFDQAGYDKAMADFQRAPEAPAMQQVQEGTDENGNPIYSMRPGAVAQPRVAPRREDFMAPDDGGGWSQTMTLTPQAQETLDKQLALSNQFADTASKGFANVQGLLENPNIDFSSLPQMRGIDMSQVTDVRRLNPMMPGGGQQQGQQRGGDDFQARDQQMMERGQQAMNQIPEYQQFQELQRSLQGRQPTPEQQAQAMALSERIQASPILRQVQEEQLRYGQERQQQGAQGGQDGIRTLNSDMSGIRGLNTAGMQDVRGINLGQLGNVRGLDTGNLNNIRQLDEAGLQSVRQLNQQNLPQTAINAGQTAQDAIFSRLNPTLQRDEEALRQRLANQGIALGSEAYNREMALAGQRATDLRLQAAAQGIGLDQAARQQAFGENQALSNFDMALQGQQFGQRQAMTAADAARRNQMFGENQAMSNFDAARRQQGLSEQQVANQADMALNNQQFGQRQAMTSADLIRNQQQFGQNQAITNSDLVRNQQAFGQNQASSQFDLNLRNQQFNEQQNLAALSGNQRNQALQEAFARQSRPLDLVNALRTGAQVQNPQFQNFAMQQFTPGPDILGATSQQYNAQVAANNAQNAQTSGLLGGIAGIGLGLAGLPGAGGSMMAGARGLFA